jgi:hypothetical protein
MQHHQHQYRHTRARDSYQCAPRCRGAHSAIGYRSIGYEKLSALELHLWCRARLVLTLRTVLLLLLIAGVLTLFWPAPATAGTCSDTLPWTDVNACVQGGQYTIARVGMAVIWTLPRMLLQGAYYVGALRGFIVDTVFSGIYDALADIVVEVIVGMLTLALLLWGLFQMGLPLLRRNLLNLRHILTWGILTPLLITSVLGPAFAVLDGLRVTLGGAFFRTAFTQSQTSFFPGGSDMPNPTPLYPATACPGAPLERPLGTPPDAVFLDDLAAALLYADAQDIHCPEVNETLSPPRPADVPRAFYDDPPDYTFADPSDPTLTDQLGELADASEREAALTRVQSGLYRMLMGITPAGLALVEALMQFCLSLALVIVWLSFPIVSLFIVFHQDEGPLLVLLQRSARIFQVTLVTSVLVGVVTALLVAAAAAGSAMAFTGMALVAALLTIYLLFTAFSVLWESILAFRESITVHTGTDPVGALEWAGGAVMAGGGALVTGGATLAGGAALGMGSLSSAAGSGMSSAGGALASGITPLFRVGEVAAGMGLAHEDRDTGPTRQEREALTRRSPWPRQPADQDDEPYRFAPGMTLLPPAVAPPALPDRRQEEVERQVSRNWEHLRDTVSLDPPTEPATGATIPLTLPASSDVLPHGHEQVVLDAPGMRAAAQPPSETVHLSDDLRDVTERELREQTGAVTHGMQEMTAALREGMRDLADATRTDDLPTDDAPADDAHDLAWELEANSDRDTLLAHLRQDDADDPPVLNAVPQPPRQAQVDTQQLAQGMRELTSTMREQAAVAAVKAVAAAGTGGAGGGSGDGASSGDDSGGGSGGGSGGSGSTTHEPGERGSDIARTLGGTRPTASRDAGSGSGEPGSGNDPVGTGSASTVLSAAPDHAPPTDAQSQDAPPPSRAEAAPAIQPQPASADGGSGHGDQGSGNDPAGTGHTPAIQPQPASPSGSGDQGAGSDTARTDRTPAIQPQPAASAPAPAADADPTRDPRPTPAIQPQPATSPGSGHGDQGSGNDPAATGRPPTIQPQPATSPGSGSGDQGSGNDPAATGRPPTIQPQAADTPSAPAEPSDRSPTPDPRSPAAPPPPPPRARPAPPRQAADDPTRDPPADPATAEADPTRDPPDPAAQERRTSKKRASSRKEKS